MQTGGHDPHGLPTVWRATHASDDGRSVQRVVWRLNTAVFLNGDTALSTAPKLNGGTVPNPGNNVNDDTAPNPHPNLNPNSDPDGDPIATGGSAVSLPMLPQNFHIVSSLPDVSEVRPRLTPLEYETWCANVVERMLDLLPPDSVCILYQTPGRDSAEGGAWLDKGFLCQLGARAAAAACVWQKVVLPNPDAVGLRQSGTRVGFINLLCFSKRHRVPRDHVAVDVVADRGHMTFANAMGEAACSVAIEYCKQLVGDAEPTIVDPFCGHGSVLAVANALGLPSVGMEISLKCCAIAAAHVAKDAPFGADRKTTPKPDSEAEDARLSSGWRSRKRAPALGFLTSLAAVR